MRCIVKIAGDEEKSAYNTRRLAEVFSGEDKRRLSCPKCSHVQVLYQNFADVGVSVGIDKNLEKARLQNYKKVTINGYPCQMCENDKDIVQETILNRGRPVCLT